MKTEAMAHQKEALRLMNGREQFALLMDQGTGKTWVLLADAERLYSAGKIDAMLIIAPKGVHTNWVRREIPSHMDESILARAWRSGAGKRERAKTEELLQSRDEGAPQRMRVLAMNIDALGTKPGFDFAQRFLLATRAVLVVDESSRIKNPSSLRTKQLMRLQHRAPYRRIATGTPITNSPVDVFAQFEFLESGLLGTTSYRTFTAEYAELLSPTHPLMVNLVRRNPKAAYAQMVAKNEDGSPRWRNLDKLQKLIAPHSFRVLKRDCLDLPEKIYQQLYFELDDAQQSAYRLMEREQRLVLEDGEVTAVAKLSAIMKLQQITSGFIIKPERGGLMYVSEGNPRLAALVEAAEEVHGKFIVWARFKEELRAVAQALRAAGRCVVEYHGDVSPKDREVAVDEFQHGEATVFVGQPQSGGIGLTLTAAETVFYYSNDYNSETRRQSEDRAHRIGTRRPVLYIDLVATDTIDEEITTALQRKSSLAAMILGDQEKPDENCNTEL